MLMMNEDSQNNQLSSSEERELRKKWLHENGLFSQEPSQPLTPEDKEEEGESREDQQYFTEQQKSIELGEEPMDVSRKDLINEEYDLESRQLEKVKPRPSSPPTVVAKSNPAAKPPPIPKP